jgi:hypothetical protein
LEAFELQTGLDQIGLTAVPAARKTIDLPFLLCKSNEPCRAMPSKKVAQQHGIWLWVSPLLHPALGVEAMRSNPKSEMIILACIAMVCRTATASAVGQ